MFLALWLWVPRFLIDIAAAKTHWIFVIFVYCSFFFYVLIRSGTGLGILQLLLLPIVLSRVSRFRFLSRSFRNSFTLVFGTQHLPPPRVIWSQIRVSAWVLLQLNPTPWKTASPWMAATKSGLASSSSARFFIFPFVSCSLFFFFFFLFLVGQYFFFSLVKWIFMFFFGVLCCNCVWGFSGSGRYAES